MTVKPTATLAQVLHRVSKLTECQCEHNSLCSQQPATTYLYVRPFDCSCVARYSYAGNGLPNH